MTIQESLDRLVNILQSVNKDSFQETFPHIAEALEIDTENIDTEDTEAMISSIREAVSNIEENDVEAVVEEINQFFTEDDESTADDQIDEQEKKKKDDEESDDDEESEKEDDEEYKKKKKKDKKEESFYITSDDLDMKEDTSALFQGEELSEEFQDKAKTIFETAVVNKVNEKVAQIIEEYEDVIEEKTQEIEESYAEKLDEYLDYVISEWTKENKIALESGIRSEMNESLMNSLKDVFENHYIELPEEKVEMVEDLQSKVAELEQGLNESLDQNAKLSRQLRESKKEDVMDGVMEGLSDMQREKLRELLESVEIEDEDTDLSEYKKRANIIKENYFPTSSQELNEDNRSDDIDPVNDEPEDSSVNRYAQALERLSNK